MRVLLLFSQRAAFSLAPNFVGKAYDSEWKTFASTALYHGTDNNTSLLLSWP